MIQASEPDPNVVDFGRNRAGRELLTKEIGSAIFSRLRLEEIHSTFQAIKSQQL
jgi:hypothetical protein